MECVADRFVMTDRESAIDLATGETIRFVVSSAGGHDEQLRWASRCDGLYRAGSIVDYGSVGEFRRFEAIRLGAETRAASEHVEQRGLS